MAAASVVPRPPHGPRPDYLPNYRAGTRYLRRDSLPPLERHSAIESCTYKPMRDSAREKPFKGARPITSSNPARHTAKSRARAAFLEDERAKFDERFPPVRQGTPARAVVVEKPLFKERIPSKEPSLETLHSDVSKQSEKSYTSAATCLSNISATRPITPFNSAVTNVSSTGVFTGVNYYTRQAMTEERKHCAVREEYTMALARREEEYAKAKTEREQYAKVIPQIKRMIAEYKAFLAQHPTQLTKIKQRMSVDVDEAEKARRAGDCKREFAILKAHLHDLFYNKAQVVTQLKKEEEEQKLIEERMEAEIQRIKQNDELIIERKVRLLHEMLNEEFPSDEEDKDSDEDGEEEDSDENCDADKELESDEDSVGEEIEDLDEDSEEEDYDEQDEGEEEYNEESDEGKQNMDYDGDTSDCEDTEEENITLNDTTYPSHTPPLQGIQNVLSPSNHPSSCCCKSRKSASMPSEIPESYRQQGTTGEVVEYPDEDCEEEDYAVGYGSSQQSHVRLMMMNRSESSDFDAKAMEDFASEVEEGVLEKLAKLGRLLRLETAHTGTDNNQMLRKVESLLVTVEKEHETGRDTSEKERCASDESDKRKDCEINNEMITKNRPTELANELIVVDETAELTKERSLPDVKIDDEEEESGPILPAFTSTSINTNCADSKASFEALRSSSSTQNRSRRSEGNESTSVAVSIEETKEKNAESVTMENSRSGKKQVSFVQEDSNQGRKPRSITFYAKMSVNDLGQLISSALVSDIMPYATDSKGRSSDDENSSDDSESSVIAVKFVSVMTEKNKTSLLPAFAEKHKEKQNSLAFSITGEILLSTPMNEVSRKSSNTRGSVVNDVVDMNQEGKSPTVSSGIMKIPSVHCQYSKETKQSEVSTVQMLTMGYEEESGPNKKHADVPDMSQEVHISHSTTDAVSDDIRLKPADQESGMPKDSVLVLGSTNNVNEVPQTSYATASHCAPTVTNVECSTQTQTSPENTDKALLPYNPHVFVPNGEMTSTQMNGESCVTFDTCIVTPLQLEVDVPVLSETIPVIVAKEEENAEKALVLYNPQVLNPMHPDTAATNSFTLDKITLTPERSEFVGKGLEQEVKGTCMCEVTIPSTASDTTTEVKTVEALVPYSSQLFTPNVFNNAAEQLVAMGEMALALTYPESCETVERNDSKDSELQTQNGCEVAAALSAAERNTEKALVTFNSQIITLKAFDTAAEPDTLNDVTLTQTTSQAEVTEDVELGLEAAPTSGVTTTCSANNGDSATGKNEKVISLLFASENDDGCSIDEEKDISAHQVEASSMKSSDAINSSAGNTRHEDAESMGTHDVTTSLSAAESNVEENTEKPIIPFNSQIVTLKTFNTAAEPDTLNTVTITTTTGQDQVGNKDAKLDLETAVTTTYSANDGNDPTWKNEKVISLSSSSESNDGCSIDEEQDVSAHQVEASSMKSSDAGNASSTGDEDAQSMDMRDMTASLSAAESNIEENTEKAIIPFNSQIVTLKTFNTAVEPNALDTITKTASRDENEDAKRDLESDPSSVVATTCSDMQEGVNSAVFNSKIRKSLPSFRRIDLEKAVNPQDKHCQDKKLRLRRTKSRPMVIPLEPRQALLPLRSKVIQNHKSRSIPTGESGTVEAKSREVMQQRSRQLVTSREMLKNEPVEKSSSGVKSSKSFQSQLSLITADVTLLQSPYPSKPTNNRKLSRKSSHLDNIQGSDVSIKTDREDGNCSSSVLLPVRETSRLYKHNKSLPATFREDGNRLTKQLKRNQSERASSDTSVPKLPKL